MSVCSRLRKVDFFDLTRAASFRWITVGDRQAAIDCTRTVAASGMRPVIDRVTPFEEAKAAFVHLEASSHIGKIVIKVLD